MRIVRSEPEKLCWILLRAGIELKHTIGSDDQLLNALTQELERRRVKFERDAVILISDWDSFYGRVLPIEFTAAVCHRVAHRSAGRIKSSPRNVWHVFNRHVPRSMRRSTFKSRTP